MTYLRSVEKIIATPNRNFEVDKVEESTKCTAKEGHDAKEEKINGTPESREVVKSAEFDESGRGKGAPSELIATEPQVEGESGDNSAKEGAPSKRLRPEGGSFFEGEEDATNGST